MICIKIKGKNDFVYIPEKDYGLLYNRAKNR